MLKKTIITALLLSAALCAFAAEIPKRTVKFAQRDTCELFMDIYEPVGETTYTPATKDSVVTVFNKPTVVFVFGGGFAMGSRDNETYTPWFRLLSENGYKVVSIDYRLGLKSKKLHIPKDRGVFLEAVDAAVEDLFSATAYIIEHAGELGIDPDNMVAMGSSAGALTVLSADWYLSNRYPLAQALPEGFRYKGIFSFSGAIITDKGIPKYPAGVAPTLLLHGTSDNIVMYKGFKLGSWGLLGSDKLDEVFKKADANFSILRYKDHTHDIALALFEAWGLVRAFLERNVMEGKKTFIDALIEDTTFEPMKNYRAADLYKKNK